MVKDKSQSAFSLYVKAMKEENNGNLEAAFASYKSAYEEAAKTKFQQDLKLRILIKMKVLHSMKAYHNKKDLINS